MTVHSAPRHYTGEVTADRVAGRQARPCQITARKTGLKRRVQAQGGDPAKSNPAAL
jgi:hypothetical protein